MNISWRICLLGNETQLYQEAGERIRCYHVFLKGLDRFVCPSICSNDEDIQNLVFVSTTATTAAVYIVLPLSLH